MTKQALIDYVASEAGMTKVDAGKAIDAFVAGVKKGLKKEGKVTLVGFGTFEAKKRAAREGRNPQTGATVKIPARVVPTFKAGSQLKEAVN